MSNFFSTYFNFANIMANLIVNLIWAILMSILFRFWILFRKTPLSKRKEIAFWLLAPVTCLIVLLAIGYAISPKPLSPDFICTIDRVNTGELKDGRPYIVLVVAIRNKGSQSIAESYALNFTIPGGHVVPGKLTSYPDQMKLQFKDGKTEILYTADALDRKTAIPIPTGGLARGRLFYVYPIGTPLTIFPPVSLAIFAVFP